MLGLLIVLSLAARPPAGARQSARSRRARVRRPADGAARHAGRAPTRSCPGAARRRAQGAAADRRQVGAIADAVAKVRRERREYPGSTREVFLKGVDRWQVSYFARTPEGAPRKEIAQVLIDDRSARVVEAWTDYQVPWSMARGYPGAFGRIVNAPWVWIPLAVLFVAPFLRPPWGMLHLDLLVLSAFSASTAFFNAARIDVAVPLCTRCWRTCSGACCGSACAAATARRGGAAAAALLVPVRWLAIAVIFLVGFRVALNVTNSNVIDVGYAGVIGADRIVDGSPLYGAFPSDNASGDTYGPVVYLAYVPFEQALTWSGRWDDLPAAHAAAIAFDLLACAAAVPHRPARARARPRRRCSRIPG